MKENSISHFVLEFVFDDHFQFVSSTTQQTFILRNSKSQFHSKYSKCQIPTFNDFWQISFTKLKNLNLSSANILSLEFLTYCDLPLIKNLLIDDNHIISLSVISKCSFKYLTYVSCFMNSIISIDKFNRSFMPSLVKFLIDDNNRLSKYQHYRM